MKGIAMAKKRRRVSNCKDKSCGGKYLLTYEGGAPIFTCEKCGDQDLTWKKFYKEYLQLFRTKSNWSVKKHQVSCVIGFFCHMYKEFYKTDYVFVPKNPNPYGAKECKDAWSLLAAFNGDAHQARKYIYWAFKKGIGAKANIVSFAYINTPGLIRRYNLYNKKKRVLSRESKLPKKFIDWCRDNASNIFDNYELDTMNDLGALLSYTTHYNKSDGPEGLVLEQASKLNLIKSGKLNVGEER